MTDKWGIYTDTHFITFDTCYRMSSTKYFVARQKCGRNPLLPFHDNTKPFYVVDNYNYTNNKRKTGLVLKVAR